MLGERRGRGGKNGRKGRGCASQLGLRYISDGGHGRRQPSKDTGRTNPSKQSIFIEFALLTTKSLIELRDFAQEPIP
jgi:hypothetical protein